MAQSEDELRLQLDLDLAEARKRKAELEGTDWGAVGEGAEAGALASAATLPVVAAYARYRNLGASAPRSLPAGSTGAPAEPPAPYRASPSRFSPHGGRAERLGAMVSSFARDVGESAARNPTKFAAAELAGGAAAGGVGALAREMAHDQEVGPTGEAAAELAGNVAGGLTGQVLPVGALNAMSRAARWGMQDLGQILGSMPLTGFVMSKIPVVKNWPKATANTIAERRAAAALQSRAADPEQAAQDALAAPEGVTPARATQDPGLMGIEARIAMDDPAWKKAVDDDLQSAIAKAQGELKALYSTPRGRQDWEASVVQRGAPPGATVAGDTPQQMVDSAYEAYEPVYDQFRNWPAKARLLTTTRKTPLAVMLRNAVNSSTSMAGDDTRRNVGRWLEARMGALRRREGKNGEITTGDLLSFRSAVRAKAREARKSQSNDAQERAELLDIAEDRINQVIKTWLPKDGMAALNAVDRQYGVLKTIEKAMGRSKNRELTPDNLLAELRYGGGKTTREMRTLAQSGRRAADIYGKPDAARAVAGELDEAGRTNLQNDLVHTMLQRSTLDDGGVDAVKFLNQLRGNQETARALGMSYEQLGRLDRIAQTIKMMQAPSPGAVDKLMNDGPSDVLQLISSIAASKVASEVGDITKAKAGQLAFAGFMTRYYRRLLNGLTADRAAALLMEASKNPTLYAALLTKSTAPPRVHAQVNRMLNSWLGTAAASGGDLLENLRREADELE